MTTAAKAARGAAWLIISSVGARIIGVIGTMIMTRYLSPGDVGEVSAASIIAMTAGWLTTWGFGPYVVVKGRGADAGEVAFHATVAYIGLGVLGLGAVSLAAGSFGHLVDAPSAAVFVPGMALSVFIRRIGAVPEKILTRRMQFRVIGLSAAAGELVYAGTAIPLAAYGYGGNAVVIGNIVQSTVVVAMIIRAAGFAEWAQPVRLRAARVRDMLRFGLPLSLESVAHNASRYWDNLMVSHLFGRGPTGLYNLGYNLADIPAVQVGEQLAHVLLPSMASLPPERRPRALERATALLSVLIFPLAVGLGLIAEPLVALVLPPAWQEVAPLLTILTTLSIFRPITWVLSAYMEAQDRTARLMFLEVGKLVVLLGLMALLAPLGLHWVASAVGVSYGLMCIAGIALVSREGPSWRRLLVSFVQPLAACVVMAAVIEVIEQPFGHLLHPGIQLPLEIVAGGVAYVAAALVLCRATVRDLLDLARRARKRPDSAPVA